MRKISICSITDDYIKYLNKYDGKVAVNKNEKRKYVGTILYVNGLKYFAPLSSPKEKHKFMKKNLDVVQIDNGELGVINLNNMIPVCDQAIISFNINEEQDVKYKGLLKKQFKFLNENFLAISKKAEKVYKIVNSQKQPKLSTRCCNYRLLESKCNEYIEINKALEEVAVTKEK